MDKFEDIVPEERAQRGRLSAQCKPIVSAHKIGAGKPLADQYAAQGLDMLHEQA